MNRPSFDSLPVGQLFVLNGQEMVKINAIAWFRPSGRRARANAITNANYLRLIPPNQRVTIVEKPSNV